MQLDFQIATPEKVVYKDKIDKVSLPTELGQITILPGHIPLVATLTAGEMVIYRNEQAEPYAVTGGFVEVKPGNNVVVLADACEHIEEIDEQRAKEAAARAKKLMEGKRVDDVKFAEAQVALERSLTRLRIARKRHHNRPPVTGDRS